MTVGKKMLKMQNLWVQRPYLSVYLGKRASNEGESLERDNNGDSKEREKKKGEERDRVW